MNQISKVLSITSYVNSDIIQNISSGNYLNLRENDNNAVQSISQTCSKTGETNLVSTIIQNGANSIPGWVTDNSSTMQLQMSTPSVSVDTTYSFQIKTTYGSLFSDQKIINLKVLNWQVSNWLLWQVDPMMWQTWSSGYSLSSDNKSWTVTSSSSSTASTSNTVNTTDVSSTVKSTQATAQAAVGAGVAVGSTTSILSATSTQGAWASINQFQLYLLVPMLGIYIHQDVLDFLKGFGFVSFSFSFLRFEEFQYIKPILSMFSDRDNSSYLSSIGLPHVNSYRNLTKFFIVIMTLLYTHMWIILPWYLYSRKYSENNIFRKIVKHIMSTFMLSIYVRVMLETYNKLRGTYCIWLHSYLE